MKNKQTNRQNDETKLPYNDTVVDIKNLMAQQKVINGKLITKEDQKRQLDATKK